MKMCGRSAENRESKMCGRSAENRESKGNENSRESSRKQQENSRESSRKQQENSGESSRKQQVIHAQRGKKRQGVILPVLLGALTFVCCYPILFLLTGSIMGQGELVHNLGTVFSGAKGYASWPLLPFEPTLRSYAELILDTPDFFVMFWNSMEIAGGILLGQMLLGVPAAWGFARYRFPFSRGLFFLYIVMMMMPFQVMMLSDYLVINRMHLLDTMGAIIFPGIFSTLPVFVICQFFKEIPEELLEAARIDGAGEGRIFLQIGLPLGKAGIISALVLEFLECWNMLEQPMAFLKSQRLWPLSLFQPRITAETAGAAFAASVLALLPAIWVFAAGHEFLEQGIAAYYG